MRKTVTATGPTIVYESPYGATAPGLTDADTVSFSAFAPAGSGVVLLKPGPKAGPAPDMADAARWDFGKLALNYTLEPGRALYGQAATGSVDLDCLEGGER